MPRKPVPQHLQLKYNQDRPGQIPRRGTWQHIAWEMLSPDHYTGTNKAFQAMADRYPHLSWDVYRRTLTQLGKRQLIERLPIPGKSVEMQQRRLIIG